MPAMEASAVRDGTWRPTHKYQKNMKCYDNAVKEWGFPAQRYDIKENAEKQSVTSLTIGGMQQAEIMTHIERAPLRPNDDTKTMVGLKARKPMPKWKDQVEQSQKFAAKNELHDFKHARKELDAGYDNDFTHLLKSGYQQDFVGAIDHRDARQSSVQKATAVRSANNDKTATAAWMKTHKNPLLSPAPKKERWVMKKFANATAKTDSGSTKRRVAKQTPIAIPRKPATPEPVAAPAPAYVAPVAAPAPVAEDPAKKVFVSETRPW